MSEPPTKDWRTDAQLFDAINRADFLAFETLYGRHRDWVYSLAWRFTRNHEDACDVLQESFAYLLKKAPGLKLTARITTYLYPIVRSISIDLLRKKRRHDEAVDSIQHDLTRPPPVRHASREDLATIMSSLPDPQREVLLMRYVDELALDEIAATLDIPLGTVKSRIHNALAVLRQDQRMRRYFKP